MTLTSKRWLLLSVFATVLLLGIAVFGGSYRALGTLFLPLGLLVGVNQHPEQREIRPAIRILIWLLACLGIAAAVASSITIFAGR